MASSIEIDFVQVVDDAGVLAVQGFGERIDIVKPGFSDDPIQFGCINVQEPNLTPERARKVAILLLAAADQLAALRFTEAVKLAP